MVVVLIDVLIAENSKNISILMLKNVGMVVLKIIVNIHGRETIM